MKKLRCLFILFITILYIPGCITIIGKTKITYDITAPGKGNKFVITNSDGELKHIMVNESKNITLRVKAGFVGSIIACHLNKPKETKVIIHGKEKNHTIFFEKVSTVFDWMYFYNLNFDRVAKIMPPNISRKRKKNQPDFNINNLYPNGVKI